MRFGGFHIVLWLILFSVTGDLRATENDPYTISAVLVDQTDQTAAAAREKAIAWAHKQAFARLVSRLVPLAEQERLSEVGAPDIIPLVHNFAIGDEKTSGVRYLASLTFRFRGPAVRNYLRSNGVRFADTVSKPVLILPLYESAGALLLWDRPNPWFEAWSNLPAAAGLIPVVIPAGDYDDVRELTAEQVLDADEEKLSVFARRYGASSVIAVHARHRIRSETLQRVLEVGVRWFGGVQGGKSATLSHVLADTETQQSQIAMGARAVLNWIEENWKRANLFRFDESGSIIARIPLTRLDDWIDIRRRLESVTLLRELRLLSVTRREAMVKLKHYGSARQLHIAAAQQDLLLERGSPHWKLSLARPEPDNARSANSGNDPQ